MKSKILIGTSPRFLLPPSASNAAVVFRTKFSSPSPIIVPNRGSAGQLGLHETIADQNVSSPPESSFIATWSSRAETTCRSNSSSQPGETSLYANLKSSCNRSRLGKISFSKPILILPVVVLAFAGLHIARDCEKGVSAPAPEYDATLAPTTAELTAAAVATVAVPAAAAPAAVATVAMADVAEAAPPAAFPAAA